ncbi:alanyl-tRNA editing protein Aarsd1 [Neocloeon triangulifer]|uniref:alanyl-tRNA editing protein Aarsd1 n=1 Tax=Neocloeon triangulifer TaxID=2078957 RepID=UPI00286EDD0A|nr:alanyl-tRNA editing protein Aarsd1 [Neocloeon triangulifer]
MVFKCQEDSFLKTFSTVVKSCKPVEVQIDGKAKKCFEVVLEDTIIFPEGGGQPSDIGYIDQMKVLKMCRRGAEAVHYMDCSFREGNTASLEIDWETRFDHMQQHSSQHLISAKLQQIYKFPTTSWSLNKDDTMVEFDISNTPKIDLLRLLSQLELAVNEEIKNNSPVKVTLFEPGDPGLQKAVTRGLPADHTGPIRVVSMVGDENMCCGTHIDTLSRLQMVKIVSIAPVKKKVQLRFVAGDRVLKDFNVRLARERNLSKLLQNGAADHEVVVSNLLKNSKLLEKNLKECSLEVASLMAREVKEQNPPPKFICVHRKEDANGFARVFLSEVGKDVIKLLTWGDEKGAGQMIFEGPEDVVADLGPKICEILGGKGAARGGRFQGAVSALKNRPKATQLLSEHFELVQK